MFAHCLLINSSSTPHPLLNDFSVTPQWSIFRGHDTDLTTIWLVVRSSEIYSEQKKKKKKRYMYIQCQFSLNWNNNLQFLILCLTAERYPVVWKWISWQKLENQSQQMRLIPGGVKIWKRDFKVQFKGPNFAQMIDQCAKCISWTFIRHHWLTKRSNHCFKRISRWSTWLQISHVRPFNADFQCLYWRPHWQWCAADNKSIGPVFSRCDVFSICWINLQ